MIWVDANVAGKVTTLEAATWADLIRQITEFVRDTHPQQVITWGDLLWHAKRGPRTEFLVGEHMPTTDNPTQRYVRITPSKD